MATPIFGLSTAHIKHDSIAEAVSRCSELGLDAIEFFVAEYTAQECDEIRDLTRDAGLLVDYHAPWDGRYDFSYADRDEARDALEVCIERAAAMGARHLICHLGRYDMDRIDGRERSIDQVTGITADLVETLHDSNVVLVYEDNTLCHYPNPLGDTPADFARLFNEIQSDYVGMIIDTGHANVTGNTYAYLDQFGRRVWYLHLNDNGGIGDDHLPPSAGTINWPELIAMLSYFGAEPNFCIEFNEQYVDSELPMLRSLVSEHSWSVREHTDS